MIPGGGAAHTTPARMRLSAKQVAGSAKAFTPETCARHRRKVIVNRTLAAALLLAVLSLAMPAAACAASRPPGLYRDGSGAELYVGSERELPDAAYPQYLDAKTGATGAIGPGRKLTALCTARERRRLVRTPLGVLGVSLFYRGTQPRTTILLIHGADAETREMGWIVPYFVCNGVNVISYDQRGTGESSGNWLANGPPERARDADALYDAFRNDSHVDAARFGVWGFSNGGWTAPIVAVDRPLAFEILQSAAASSVEQNVIFEAQEAMRGAGHKAADVDQAVAAWHAVLDAIEGRAPVATGKEAYAKAQRTSWFGDSLLPIVPEKTAFAEPGLDGWRRYVSYDPASTLVKVRTPTLALYGGRDTKVDVKHDVPAIEAAFRRAGMRDLTVRWFADAGHTMKVSVNGFDDARPVRYSRGYPGVMLAWLRTL